MNIKLAITLFLSFSYSITLSQKCPPFFSKGTIENPVEGSYGNFCFKKDPVVDSIPGIFHTKYTVTFGKGREMNVIHFYFYKALDSISVVYLNTVTGKTATQGVTFKNHSSIRMFKDYKANDTTINADSKYCTLFTVPDTLNPYITLNQFQLPDIPNTYLLLDPINPEKLLQHLNEVRIYTIWQDSVDLVRERERQAIAKRKNDIATLFNEMKEYKDKEIQKIIHEDNEFKTNGPAVETSNVLSEEFKNKLDPIFNNSLRDIYPCENIDSEIKFTFSSNADGKIDPLKTLIDTVNLPRVKWLDSIFRVDIEPIVLNNTYRTLTAQRTNPNLIDEFNSKYLETFNRLEPDNAEFNEFLLIKRDIYNDLEKYLKREMNRPTKYTYFLKYKSTAKPAYWKYEVNRHGEVLLESKVSGEPISGNLKDIFIKKIATPKVNKYRITICSVYINDVLIGQDIKANL